MSGNRFFVSITQNGLTRNYSIRLLLIKNIKRETWKGGQVENKTVKKVYEVEEIQNILGISRSAAYELIRETYKMQHPFKVLKIGNLYRVPTMHGLRHMFATILIEQSVSLEKISKLMGHKSVATTFEIYCGIMEAKKEIAKTIDSVMDPAIGAVKVRSKGGIVCM